MAVFKLFGKLIKTHDNAACFLFFIRLITTLNFMKNTIFTVLAAILGAGFGAGIIHQQMQEQLHDMAIELKAVKNAQSQIHNQALNSRERLTNLEVKSKKAYNPYDPFGIMTWWGF